MSSKKHLFEKLYSDYYSMVFQMCLGFMKGDSDIAKDLAQEVFINTWNALNKFKGASGYKTWIYRITVNTCLKHIRDTKDKHRISIDDGQVYASDEGSRQSEENYQSLYWAIGQLNEVDRLIMIMILDELEYDEISNIIGISEGNLRVKIHRIKKNLKKKLINE